MSTGFGELLKNNSLWLGFIVCFLGIYVIIRTGLELTSSKKEDF